MSFPGHRTKGNSLFSSLVLLGSTNREYDTIKKKLNLVELSGEGGLYREIYRSSFSAFHTLFQNSGDMKLDVHKRSSATLIYYLLDGHSHFSAFHKLKSDEIWHFYKGSALTIYTIDDSGDLTILKLGNNIDQDEQCHAIIKAGLWFGARVNDVSSFALIGCTVTPGFDYKDFELGRRSDLIKLFPQHKSLILSLTRE
jgi:predicted cupin superfamily sugar epimerase